MNTPAYSNGKYPAGDGIPELPPAHVEAPVSANCRLVLEGHEVQVTVHSGATPHEVEVVMGTMVGLIRAYASPVPSLQPTPYPPPASSQLPPASSPPTQNGEAAVPYCFEHGQNFKRHQKDGQVWYSHKIQHPVPGGATWCRYQPPPQA